MKVDYWLASAVKLLEKSSVSTARLDALVLLEDCLKQDRAYLLAHPETALTVQQADCLDAQIKRRAGHIPLAYIRGKTEFYGREFLITEGVLEPRPESETMIELLKELSLSSRPSVHNKLLIADIGTGSGVLAITAKLELPFVSAIATDIDPICLRLARKNAKNHQTSIEYYKGNLLRPIQKLEINIVLANLPYIPNNYTINAAAANEPAHAIFGGRDGLDIYRHLFEQINRGSVRVQFVFTESLPFQHQALDTIARAAGYRQQKADDFIQLFEAN